MSPSPRFRPALLWALRCALLLAAAPAAGVVPSSAHKVRGMTVSCPTDGSEWGSDAMVDTMRALKVIGVEWVAIHPYAGIGKDGGVPQWRRLALDPPPAWITRPIAEAHRLGMKVMIKPHLGYWGSGFGWRGDITFETPAQWARFFAEYTTWITQVAAVSKGADAFVVGTELDRTLDHEAEWRAVIGAVRARYDGPLTYAANWPEYERVPFWDALDIIGVQAYFPLVTEGQATTPANLEHGLRAHLAALHAFSKKMNKYVVFTELGYNEFDQTALRPWDDATGGPDAAGVQSRALETALRLVAEDDRVVGAFLWKWFPGPWAPRNFSMQAPAVQTLIARYWRPSPPRRIRTQPPPDQTPR